MGDISFEINHIKERLETVAHLSSLTELVKIPKASFYLNSHLTQNHPHRIDLTNQLTSIIPEWTPDILASDPTCPYYFSKIIHSSSSNTDRNLLAYLQAIESNESIGAPFVSILPQSYRSALPLPSIFHCGEFLHPSIDPFFYNIELIIGPGETELSFQQSSIEYSQFYCSLYGSPNVLLINQTDPTFLLEDSLTNINYISTNLTPGTCLFLPSNWLMGSQLNNSIILLFTFQTMLGKSDERCTKIEQVTLDEIPFSIEDQLNISSIHLMLYFYQYLNPPIFDQEYSSQKFLQQFQVDRNISQLVIEWTPELIELIEHELFQRLDINDDQRFSLEDYIDLREKNLKEIEENLPKLFEDIHRMILQQYNQLSETIQRISHQVSTDGFDDDDKKALINMINNLPESVKQNFRRKNMDINEILNKIYQTKSKPSMKKKLDRTDL